MIFVLACVFVLSACTNMNLGAFMPHTHADANKDTKCDTCGTYVAPQVCTVHNDLNGDGVCDTAGCGASVLLDMTEVVFESKKVSYSGEPQKLEAIGVPEGATVVYDVANEYTNVGTYDVTVTVTKQGYNDYTATATLEIVAKSIEIVWNKADLGTFPATGEEPEFEYSLSGVAEGDEVEVEFSYSKNCDFTVPGKFTVTATSKNDNYKIKTTVKTDKKANQGAFTIDANVYISFETGIDGENIENETVEIGTQIDEPRTLRRDGYNFLGWYNGEEAWDFEAPVTTSMTLVAKWQTIEYAISYNLNGGTNNPSNPTAFTIETGAVIAAPTREGCVFLGWYTDAAFNNAFYGIRAGEAKKDYRLYAKWADAEYIEHLTGDALDSGFIREISVGGDTVRYTFSANIAEFLDNGAIYIGRGKNANGGAYITVTKDNIVVTLNDGDTPTEQKISHPHAIVGHIVIDLEVVNGKVNVTMATSDGVYKSDFSFYGGNGEIFVSAENATLENVSFAWNVEEYSENTWILTEESNAWVKKLLLTGCVDALNLSSVGADSSAVLEGFKVALTHHVPVYAVWSFPTESGSDYDANLAEFLEICEEKEIIPVLTTEIGEANAAKNAAVIASGKKYIDLASLENNEGMTEGGEYSEYGVVALYVKVISDFPEIVTPTTPLKEAYAEKLDSDNPSLLIGNNKVKDGKVTIFTAKLNAPLTADQKIIVAHGYNSTYAAWQEINGKTIVTYSQGAHADGEPGKNTATHGLTIKNYITVIVIGDNDGVKNKMIVVTDGGKYEGSWRGSSCNGKIEVVTEGGVELTDAKGYWTCMNYDAPIWIFGASYFSLGDPARWPQYMYNDKLADDILIVGRGGLNTTGGLLELEDALKHGKPKYIVWGYGMNDGKDSESAIKQVTYENHIKFLEICKQNDIEPIFISSVNCTDNFHTHKIEYVENKKGEFANYDYRVASLPHAVNGYEEGSTWYEGMLSGDGIHPTKLGARNFYLELLKVFPELMIGEGAVKYSAHSDALAAGSTLKLEDTPDFYAKDFGISASLDFNGYLEGAIIIGNGKDVDGGSWAKITGEKVEIYKNVNGEEVLVESANNELDMEELAMIRIIVRDNEASVALVSSGDEEADRTTLFSVSGEWSYAGEFFVSAETTSFTDVYLNLVTE